CFIGAATCPSRKRWRDSKISSKRKIRHAGVSNFDVDDMEELAQIKGGLERIVTNQVLYNLERRGIEWDLLPWMRRRHRPIMAYSPIEEGLLTHAHPVLKAVAERHDATPAQGRARLGDPRRRRHRDPEGGGLEARS